MILFLILDLGESYKSFILLFIRGGCLFFGAKVVLFLM